MHHVTTFGRYVVRDCGAVAYMTVVYIIIGNRLL